jgi:ribosomal protein S18 acetylase RimI-like enzyme
MKFGPFLDEEVLKFLYRDPFTNVPLLAAVERRPRLVELRACGRDGVEGVLVLEQSPDGERFATLDATNPDATCALLETLPRHTPFRFGLQRPWMEEILGDVFAAEPEGTMLAFRCLAGEFRSLPGGRSLRRDDVRAVRRCRDAVFLASFHDAARGRRTRDRLHLEAFGAFDQDRLAARCLTTWGEEGIHRCVGTVWSVFTAPECRRRGFGRAVVAAATAAILAGGREARYLAYAENVASRRLCAALGYGVHHEIQYYAGVRRR